MGKRSLNWFFLLMLIVFVMSGCRKIHPREVFVHQDMEKGAIEKIAVFPFAATTWMQNEEREVACATMDNLLRSELNKRTDYKFVPTTTILPALESAGLQNQVEQWMEGWADHQEIDNDLFDELSQLLQVDAVLLGVVDCWEKTDIQEAATPATTVSASITIIELENGITMFQAYDEDYLEGERSQKIQFTTYTDKGVPQEHTRTRGGLASPDQIQVAEAIIKSVISRVPVRKKTSE